MSDIRHLIHQDTDRLAEAAALAVTHLLNARIEATGRAVLSLTGGSAGIKTASALADADLDWSRITIYFGDERFVPAGDPERNDGQVDEVLLNRLGDAPAVHRWPTRSAKNTDVDAAASEFLEAVALPDGDDPLFDVTILGMGPEGHIDSIFPHTPAVAETELLAVGVRNCPKPPPERMTFTLPAVRRSRHVIVVATGEGKAEAVARGIGGADPAEWPIAGAVGMESTTYHLDGPAASLLG